MKDGITCQIASEEMIMLIYLGIPTSSMDTLAAKVSLSNWEKWSRNWRRYQQYFHQSLEFYKTCVQVNPNLIYVCDPVMGDTGPGLYVPK